MERAAQEDRNRRDFLKSALALSAGAAGLSLEEKALLAAEPQAPVDAGCSACARKPGPWGRSDPLKVSRLICGGI